MRGHDAEQAMLDEVGRRTTIVWIEATRIAYEDGRQLIRSKHVQAAWCEYDTQSSESKATKEL